MNVADREQARAIADSASAFLSTNAGPANARSPENRAGAMPDDAPWREMAALGWLGIAVPESAGGLDMGTNAACLIAEEAGRALLASPLTMAMSAAQLLAAADTAAATETLENLLAGSVHLTFAMPDAGCGAADGDRCFVLADGGRGFRFVAASGAGESFEARMFVAGDEGTVVDARPRVDGGLLGFAQVSSGAWDLAPRLVQGHSGEHVWNAAQEMLRLVDAAYLCGLAQATLKMSLEYLHLRHQFGAAIGSFQALQHRAADCHIQLSATRALVYESTRATGTQRAAFAAAASIRQATRLAMHVARENIQFHGAIGFADELDAGLYLRRAMVVSAWHTDAALATLRMSTNFRR